MSAGTHDAFSLQFTLDGCEAEVALNDVPLAGARLRRSQGGVHATPWIVAGENELRVHVTDARRLAIFPMGASAFDLEAGPVHATARVVAGRYETLVPDPERDPVLAEVTWGPVDDDARSLPRTLVATFHVADRPRWAWQDAPPLDPAAPAVRARLVAFVRDVHAAFARGDGAAVAPLLASLGREAVHFGPHGAQLTAGFAAELGRVAAEPDFALAPFDDEDVVLRAIAGGRVLRVLHRRGGPLLRAAPTMAQGFAFRLDVAEVGGALEIVRLG